MIDENNIPSIQPDFERIKKQDNKGLEYWTSRELCTALGYGTYQKFNLEASVDASVDSSVEACVEGSVCSSVCVSVTDEVCAFGL